MGGHTSWSELKRETRRKRREELLGTFQQAFGLTYFQTRAAELLLQDIVAGVLEQRADTEAEIRRAVRQVVDDGDRANPYLEPLITGPGSEASA